jgi:hypothetical protein
MRISRETFDKLKRWDKEIKRWINFPRDSRGDAALTHCRLPILDFRLPIFSQSRLTSAATIFETWARWRGIMRHDLSYPAFDQPNLDLAILPLSKAKGRTSALQASGLA